MKNTIKNEVSTIAENALVDAVRVEKVGTVSVSLTEVGRATLALFVPDEKDSANISIKPILKEIATKATETVHNAYHGMPLSLIRDCSAWDVSIVDEVQHADKLEKSIVVPSFPLLSTERQKDVKELTALINLNVGALATSPVDAIGKKCKLSIKKYLEEIISIYFQSEVTEMGAPNMRGKDVNAFLFTTLKADRKVAKMVTTGHKSAITFIELFIHSKMNAFELSVSVNGCTKDVNGVTISNGKAVLADTPLSTLEKFHASLK